MMKTLAKKKSYQAVLNELSIPYFQRGIDSRASQEEYILDKKK